MSVHSLLFADTMDMPGSSPHGFLQIYLPGFAAGGGTASNGAGTDAGYKQDMTVVGLLFGRAVAGSSHPLDKPASGTGHAATQIALRCRSPTLALATRLNSVQSWMMEGNEIELGLLREATSPVILKLVPSIKR
jgi:hypothetical protein